MTALDAQTPTTIAPRWNEQGLIPVVTQDHETGEVLMVAWMNAEALSLTLSQRQVIYWSRSRQALWRKGETSGNTQALIDIRLDCDGDTLLLQVQQNGAGACHTGRQTCFFYSWVDNTWQLTEDH
ncbi:phosphoribosyl-AMP cyclohydrolase [Luminiphilus sp.]|nr:phosphoribosyl-AMP cyclohydrolase [Luminiphilus sp.]